MSGEEPVEALFGRQGRPSSTLRKAPAFTLGALGTDLRTIKQCVEADLDFVLDLQRRSTTADFLDKVKNDNVLLLKANQDLRALTAELQERLRGAEGAAHRGDEAEELRAKNDQLQALYAQLGRDYAQLLCEVNARVPAAQHHEEIAAVQVKLARAEGRAAEAEGRLAAQEGAPGGDTSRETNFFFSRAELAEEAAQLRAELQGAAARLRTAEAEFEARLAEKDRFIASLQSRPLDNRFCVESGGVRGRQRGMETSNVQRLPGAEGLRAENQRLWENIQAASAMNARNTAEIARLRLLLGDGGATGR